MNAEQFLDRFSYAIEADPGTLSLDVNYQELPVWDSLNLLSVIAMADADFGITLSGHDIQSCTTIGDLFRLAEAKAATP